MPLDISFPHLLVLLSVCISVGGAYVYIRDTFRGTTKPNRVSWSMWALAPLIGVGAALSSGADPWVTVRIFLAGFLPLLVFVATFFNPNSFWKITRFDTLCGLCSVLALILWGVVDSPVYAILFAAVGDGFATLPTLFKAWKFPDTETGLTYIFSFVSVILIVPSIPVWNIENAAFQIYLLLANTLLVFAVYRGRIFARARNIKI